MHFHLPHPVLFLFNAEPPLGQSARNLSSINLAENENVRFKNHPFLLLPNPISMPLHVKKSVGHKN